jgi:hypothetical protein
MYYTSGRPEKLLVVGAPLTIPPLSSARASRSSSEGAGEAFVAGIEETVDPMLVTKGIPPLDLTKRSMLDQAANTTVRRRRGGPTEPVGAAVKSAGARCDRAPQSECLRISRVGAAGRRP